jgi:hypothetical protein
VHGQGREPFSVHREFLLPGLCFLFTAGK